MSVYYKKGTVMVRYSPITNEPTVLIVERYYDTTVVDAKRGIQYKQKAIVSTNGVHYLANECFEVVSFDPHTEWYDQVHLFPARKKLQSMQ